MIYIVKTPKKAVTAFENRQKAEEYIKNHPDKTYKIVELDF